MLSDDAIARYARQIVIPGVGAAGQEKLLAATVLVVGNALGCGQAALYLRAAGVRVIEQKTGHFDLAIVAGALSIDDETRRMLLACGRPACWTVVDDHGFTSGVHPGAALPAKQAASPDSPESLFHDAAACDVASLACAVLTGLACRSEAERISLS